MNTTAARAAIASTLIGSAFVSYFGLELRLPESVVAPLGLGENASNAVAALAVPVALLTVAAVLLVQVLRAPGLVPAVAAAVVRTARARWAQRLAAVALVVGAPAVYLALAMPSILAPLSTLEVIVAYAVPSAMLLAALALAVFSFRRPAERAGALAA